MQHQLYTCAPHPESPELQQLWRWVRWLHQCFVEPSGQVRNSLVDFLFFVRRHRITSRDATAMHRVEAKGVADEIEILHDLITAHNALTDDICESLTEEARTMENESKPVQKNLRGGRDLE